MSEFLNTSKSTIEAEESIDYHSTNKESNPSLQDYSVSFKTKSDNIRTELSEINLTNEMNKPNEHMQFDDKELKVNTSSIKETRPRVYEYHQEYGTTGTEDEDWDELLENKKPTESFNSIHKSAEFTFSNFKGFKEEEIDDDIRALSEQPYFTNRVFTNADNIVDKNPYSDRYSESIRQTTSTKKSRSIQKKIPSQVEIKAQYEIYRSQYLDQESERMEAEKESQMIYNKWTKEENKLKEILNNLTLKTNQLIKLNTQKLKDSQNRHFNELETIQFRFEKQLNYSRRNKSQSSSEFNPNHRDDEFNANNCKDNIHKLKVEIEAKENIISKICKETEQLKLNWESRINGIAICYH